MRIKLLSDKEALRIYRYYKIERGFNKLHSPGGTYKTVEFYVGIYVLIFDDNNHLVGCLCVPYAPYLDNGKEQVIESSNHENNIMHSKKLLAKEKLFEKTGLSCNIAKLIPFRSVSVNNTNPEMKGKKHEKMFFFIEESHTKGKLLDLMYTNFLNRETATPLPLSLLFLVKNITYGHHFDALVDLIDIFSLRIEESNLQKIKEAIKERKTYIDRQYEKNKKKYTITLKPK